MTLVLRGCSVPVLSPAAREEPGKHAKEQQGSKGSRAFPWMAATALSLGYNFMLLRGELRGVIPCSTPQEGDWWADSC